jgi:alpha-1,3-rhamnosyl/mannosyltransferase
VLAGNWGWKSDAEREYFETTARNRGVIHLGYVGHRDLPLLYAGAAALLYPSHYEGFGLPPIEMLACGGSVIASTAPAVREVLGTHAQFVEPLDLEGWSEAMRRAATGEGLDSSDDKVRHACSYNWTRAAVQTQAVYQSVLAGISGPS